MKGETFTFVTDFDTYFIEIGYSRQNMSYTVKLYSLPPQVEIDLPIPFRFLKLPVDWMVQKLVDEPLIQRTYSISKVRDPLKAVMYTLFAYEFPFLMEKKLKSMDKRVQMNYEELAKEYFERNKKNQYKSQDIPKKDEIDWSKVTIHDWMDED